MVPKQPPPSDPGLKAAVAIAIIEAVVIIVLLGFIFLRFRRRRPSPTIEEQQTESQPTAPLIVHRRATSDNTQDYDPYEELEHPSDMPRPTPRLRLQSNISRASSGWSFIIYQFARILRIIQH